jgi:hypothetical protein
MPTPEHGYRIMRQNKYREFCDYVAEKNRELRTLASALEAGMPLIKERSRQQLGEGFSEDDYPTQIVDRFYFQVFTHLLEIPDTLEEELRQHEKQKVDALLELTIGTAETAFIEGMQQLVDALLEKLATSSDGGRKRFTGASITHILEFIEKFRVLNFRSNPELEQLMNEAEEILGLDLDMAQAIRKDGALKKTIQSRFESVSERLAALVVARPEAYSLVPSEELNYAE